MAATGKDDAAVGQSSDSFDYSDYSERFLAIDRATLERNVQKLESRIEAYRLRLDLHMIRCFMHGNDLLDFPIGTGRIYPRLLGEMNVFGYDICAPYIERAQVLNPEIADHFAVCSFEDARTDRQFDTILSFRVLTNIGDRSRAIGNVFALTRPGGRWIFTFHPHDADELAALRGQLEAAGFEQIERRRYDVQAMSGGHGPFLARFWPRWRALIERGWVPFWLFRLVDAALSRGGTYLFVAERPL